MDNGDAELNEIIARIRRIPELASECAPEATEVVREMLVQTAAAGTDPYGKPWPLRKKDGGKPLETAGASILAAPIGSRLFFRIKTHIGRHHLGRAKGGVARHVLPVDGIPPKMVAAIKRVVVEHFNLRVRGG